MTDLYQFFGYWQIVVCSFSFVALFSIWRHLNPKELRSDKDYGLLWLAIAVLTWAISGGVEVYFAESYRLFLLDNQNDTGFDFTFFEGLKSILSLLNSAFILLALPCFKHIPKLIRPFLVSQSWNWLVGITFLFSVVMTLGMLVGVFVPKTTSWIYGIDVFFGLFTVFFLTLILWESFDKRNLRGLAVLSVACILFILAAQFLKLGDIEFWKVFFSCVFKTTLIMLFFALTFSWVDERSRTYLPKPETLHLLFVKRKKGTRYEYFIILTIPPNIQTHKIIFTEKPYQLLQLFAKRRIEEVQKDGGWLEMQSKSTPHRPADIKDYNEINRILNTILDETQGAKNWDKDDRSALRQLLFEYHNNRKFRLHVLPEHIQLDSFEKM